MNGLKINPTPLLYSTIDLRLRPPFGGTISFGRNNTQYTFLHHARAPTVCSCVCICFTIRPFFALAALPTSTEVCALLVVIGDRRRVCYSTGAGRQQQRRHRSCSAHSCCPCAPHTTDQTKCINTYRFPAKHVASIQSVASSSYVLWCGYGVIRPSPCRRRLLSFVSVFFWCSVVVCFLLLLVVALVKLLLATIAFVCATALQQGLFHSSVQNLAIALADGWWRTSMERGAHLAANHWQLRYSLSQSLCLE